MNHRLIDALMNAVAPVVRDYFGKAVEPLLARLDAVEKRPPVKGEQGPPGDAGVKGDAGLAGEQGLPGKDGAPGERGIAGEPGPDGAPGEKGDPGAPGEDGVDGVDGAPGERGDKGADGLNGKDGRDGAPAELGLAPDDVAEQIAKAISLLAESPPLTAKTAPVVVNLNSSTQKKTITTRRDKDGNLVADVVVN